MFCRKYICYLAGDECETTVWILNLLIDYYLGAEIAFWFSEMKIWTLLK